MAADADSRAVRSPLLVAAGLTATVVVATAWALRVAVETPATAPLPQRLLPVLVALAMLCAVGLLLDRAPRAAWLAAATAAGVAAVEILAICRALLPQVDIGGQPFLVTLGAAAGLSAAAVAIGYALAPRTVDGEGRLNPVVTVGAAGAVAAGLALAGWAVASTATGPAIAADAGEDAPVRVMARVLLGIVALGVIVGLLRDVGGAAVRARARPPEAPFLGAFADELFPLRVREQRRAAEAERARLAADLHAIVLPELRDAAAAIERGADPADVAAGLRRSLEGVERLMHERQSILLEEFGLVAALEWLAERTEERADLVVELELEGERVAERDALPPDVARAAFRVALLALDNVVRHAGARRAAVRLDVQPSNVRLSLVDDGGRRQVLESGGVGRGLHDMRRAAEAVGASLDIDAGGGGTAVHFVWPVPSAAGHPATTPVESAARRGALGR